MNLGRNIRLTAITTKAMIQAESQYRIGALTWVINGVITPLLMMSVWLVVGSKSSLVLTQTQIVTYYLLVLVVYRVTQVWSISDVGKVIRDGTFSFRLVKPLDYLISEFGKIFGLKFYRLVVVVPLFLVLANLLSKNFNLSFTPLSGALFLASLFLGFVLRLLMENTLAIMVIWVGEYESLDYLHELISSFLSGSLLPLALAPVFVQGIFKVSPFRFYVSFPIEIALGQIKTVEVWQEFGLGLFYVLLFLVIYKSLVKIGIKKFSGYGQ